MKSSRETFKKVVAWTIAILCLYIWAGVIAFIEIAIPLGALEKSIAWAIFTYIVFKFTIGRFYKKEAQSNAPQSLQLIRLPEKGEEAALESSKALPKEKT